MIVQRARPEKSVTRRLVDLERRLGGYDQLSTWEAVAPDPFDIDDAEVFIADEGDTDDDPGELLDDPGEPRPTPGES